MTKKEQLIKAAYNNFYKNGFTASGVDKIISDSKISKKTLYTYFRSKDELYIAVLEFYFSEFKRFIQSELDKKMLSSKETILYLFDIVKKWIKINNNNGCLAINALNELSEGYTDVKNSCLQFKEYEKEFIESLLKKENIKSKHLASSLVMLIDGAVISSKVFGTDSAFNSAKNSAKDLLKV